MNGSFTPFDGSPLNTNSPLYHLGQHSVLSVSHPTLVPSVASLQFSYCRTIKEKMHNLERSKWAFILL